MRVRVLTPKECEAMAKVTRKARMKGLKQALADMEPLTVKYIRDGGRSEFMSVASCAQKLRADFGVKFAIHAVDGKIYAVRLK